MNSTRFRCQASRILLSCLLLLSWGCVHRIHVTPAPPAVSTATITQSVDVFVPFLAIEGADHMPGIPLLEWPAQDLRTAVIDYIRSRRTFTHTDSRPADLTLTVKAWLTMRYRGNYQYKLRLESALGPSDKPQIKSYLVEKETMGSPVRWITASDQTPIAEAIQAALDDLLSQIEADYLLYRTKPH